MTTNNGTDIKATPARHIGEIEIIRIEEMTLLEPPSLLPDWHSGMAGEAAYQPWLADFYSAPEDSFHISIHSWLLKTPTHIVIIDTCAGNGKERPASLRFDHLETPYLARLAAAGVMPEEVDLVICTHFHVDHIGWNTRLVDGLWVPTFPNASYILSRRECEARDPRRTPDAPPSPWHQTFRDSIQPVLDAGLGRLVEGNESIVDGIDLIPVPGHSPGQIAVRVRSGGEEALFTGDVMHHPLQIHNPGWNSKFCEDPPLARITRQQVLHHCADHASLLLPAHFAAPHCGHVQRDERGFSFEPVDTKT